MAMSKGKKQAIGCGVVALLIAIPVAATVYLWADFPLAAMRLGAAEERARKAGVPLTQEELRPAQPIPEDQNSAPVYQRIFAEHEGAFRTATTQMEEALAKPELGPREALRIAEGLAEPAREAYQASKLPYFDLQHDLDLGMLLMFPHFGQFHELTRFFLLRGIAQAQLGQADEAVRDLATAHRLADHVGQGPAWVSMAVSRSLHERTLRATRRAAEGLAQNPGALRRLEREVLPMGDVRLDLRRAMLGEAFTSVAILRNLDVQTVSHPLAAILNRYFMATGAETDLFGLNPGGQWFSPPAGVQPDLTQIRRSGMPPGWVMQGSMARLLDAWSAFFEAVPESGATEEDYQEGFRRMQQALDDHRLSYFLPRDMTLTLASQPNLRLHPQATLRITRAYLGVLQFRSQRGRWPETLAEAGVEAVDPFDDKPLRYRQHGDGFHIWSAGPNRVDDGGNDRDDLLARYPNFWGRSRNRV